MRFAFLLLLVAAVAVAAACEASTSDLAEAERDAAVATPDVDAGPAPNEVTPERFCRGREALREQRMAACFGVPVDYLIEDDVCAGVGAAVASLDAVFDRDRAIDCLEAWARAPCEDIYPEPGPSLQVCDFALAGLLEPGAACTLPDFCRYDTHCDAYADPAGNCTFTCVDDPDVPHIRRGELGDACVTYADCVNRLYCINQRCELYRAIGQTCDTHRACAYPLFCASEGRCRLRARAGEACGERHCVIPGECVGGRCEARRSSTACD